MNRKWLLISALVTVASLAVRFAGGAELYETPVNQMATDVVPRGAVTGPHYKIRKTVVFDGYMHQYTVDSDYGVFEVTGDGALRKVLREIQAITALRETKNTSAYADGLKKAATAPFSLAKNLIQHPVDTVTGLPKGAYQVIESSAVGATSSTDPSEDSRIKQVLKFSSWKRDAAAKLGVDPYSSNKVLQKELNSVAWASTLGDWTVSLATLPAGGTAVTVMSNMRLADSVKNAIKEEPPARLRIINDEKLQAMGVPEGLRKRFLDHPHFTPTDDTVLVEALAGLGAARGRDDLLEAALAADDEVLATFYVNLAQMLRGYHDTVSPIREIRAVNRRLMVAQADNGSAVIAMPVDYLTWTQRVDQLSHTVRTTFKPPSGRFELWVAGTTSPQTQQELQKRGFTLSERVGTRIVIFD